MTEPASYKDTLNLPKTNFDMKANLITREPAMLKQWQEARLYKQIRARAHPKGKWVLHDGPPYANGDIHIGHLVNKVLKDIVVKFRTMQGHDSPFVPGWDCHGLPIESAIQKELGPKFRELSKEELRNKCQAYAMKFVKLQGDSFQRLGILGEFDKPYLTLDPKYEAGILEVLAELVERDLVYRQKKPVHWCVNDRTALAEAELEYMTKMDTSIFVMFPITPTLPFLTESFSEGDLGASAADLLIWTTTPWTLPANRAVAVHPDYEYVGVYCDSGPRNYPNMSFCVIVAKELAAKVMAAAGVEKYRLSKPITGRELVALQATYGHPITRTPCPIVLADYVTLEDGTGLVHTAPGHGKEDYATGQKYGLEVYNPVLADGRYDDTVPEFLRGKTIWDANQLVCDHLMEETDLFHHVQFSHEYPHCWRCKKPVIFRATEQWFVKASMGVKNEPNPAAVAVYTPSAGDTLWERAMKWAGQDSIQYVPEWGKHRLFGMLENRPDWCISRQRSWGVPIPAFFDEQGKCLLTEQSVRAVAAYFKVHGATSWYTDSPGQILGVEHAQRPFEPSAEKREPVRAAEHGTPSNPSAPTTPVTLESLGFPAGTDVSKLTKGADILDVWFESGASHHAVLECTHAEELNKRPPGEKPSGYPADMYLEGSDQHRGWFQSSLLEAAGYKNEPPFKQLLTHGFVVDAKGLKYSKSSGNYVPLETLLKQHGADVLRLWVSSVDYQNDIRFDQTLLTSISEAYRKIRNTIRYLLGNLYDFDPTKDLVEPKAFSIDAWMMARLAAVTAEVTTAYDTYEFHKVFRTVYEFCNVEISSIYAKAIKDRLYCELPDDPKRRSSQSVCYRALVALIELAAPVLVYTAEESFAALKQLPGCGGLEPSVHVRELSPAMVSCHVAVNPVTKEEIRVNASWADAPDAWAVLMPLVEKGLKQLDDLKRTIGLGNALDAEAVIILPTVEDKVSRLIHRYGPELEDALGVGFHRVEHGEIWDIKIHDTREKYASCARSWKRRPDVGSDPAYPDLSARDAAVVRKLRG